MDKIKVGITGYGTIGKRVADAINLQDDMELIGTTAHSYNYRMIAGQMKNIPMYAMPDAEGIEKLKIVGNFDELLKQSDIIVDCAPKKFGAENKEKYYVPNKVKAIFQGGEKDKVGELGYENTVHQHHGDVSIRLLEEDCTSS